MAEVDQYAFSHLDLLKLLIKDANVREGKWILAPQFGVTMGQVGPNPRQVNPGVVILLNKMAIQRIPEETEVPPGAIVVDASVVNPG